MHALAGGAREPGATAAATSSINGRGTTAVAGLVEAERRVPCVWLDDGVLPRGGAKPVGAELGRAFEGVEVDVHHAKAVAVAGHPLKVVHHAPVEVALDRHAVRG